MSQLRAEGAAANRGRGGAGAAAMAAAAARRRMFEQGVPALIEDAERGVEGMRVLSFSAPERAAVLGALLAFGLRPAASGDASDALRRLCAAAPGKAPKVVAYYVHLLLRHLSTPPADTTAADGGDDGEGAEGPVFPDGVPRAATLGEHSTADVSGSPPLCGACPLPSQLCLARARLPLCLACAPSKHTHTTHLHHHYSEQLDQNRNPPIQNSNPRSCAASASSRPPRAPSPSTARAPATSSRPAARSTARRSRRARRAARGGRSTTSRCSRACSSTVRFGNGKPFAHQNLFCFIFCFITSNALLLFVLP